MKEDLRIRRTRKLLVQALLKLMLEDRIKLKDLTVNQICEEAMVHRSTFYKYYSDKYDLFFKEMSMLDISPQISNGDRITTPFQFVEQQEHNETRQQITLLNEDDDYFNELRSRSVLNAFKRDLTVHLERKKVDVPIEIMANIYEYTLSVLMTSWLKNGKKESPEEMDAKLKQLLNPVFFE